MVGRRRIRAASTSTVATVDVDAIRYEKESHFLKPIVPGTHSDEWDCFLLADASVYDKDGKNMANLLHVDFEGPFVIRGRAEVEPDQCHRLVKPSRARTAWIEISASSAYSMGLNDANVPVLWASGQAGWFEVVPSQQYAPVAKSMFQGVSLYYSILDQYTDALKAMERAAKPKTKNNKRKFGFGNVDLSIDNILTQYAVDIGDGVTKEGAIQRCRNQAGFLLARLPEETAFHKWLSAECPEIAQKLSSIPNVVAPTVTTAQAAPEEAPEPKSVERKSRSVESPGSTDIKGKSKAIQKRSATRSTRNSAVAEPLSIPVDSDGSPATSSRGRRTRQSVPRDDETAEQADVDMRDFALGADEAIQPQHSTAHPAEMEHSSVLPEGTSQGLATLLEIFNERRAELLDDISSGKKKKHPDEMPITSWQTTLYQLANIKNYESKAEILQYYAADLARYLSDDWHRSELYLWAKHNAKKKPTFEHVSKEQILTLVKRRKMPRQSTSARDAGLERSQSTSDFIGKQPKQGRPSGKKAGLRPSMGGKKRLRGPNSDDEDAMDIDEDQYRRKSARTSEYFSNGDDEEVADITSSSEDDDEEDKNKDLVKVVIQAEKLPSTQPKGPDATWACEEPDCGYIVRSADELEGQELISKHYEEHEKNASDEAKERELSQISLVMQERGHMPINHLLEKIRKATEKHRDQEIRGLEVPQPIKRSLQI